MYETSLFIFRRSLRLDDNTGLIEALKSSKQVIPIFIFTPEQVVKNSFKSDNAVQFMIESLGDLEQQLKKKGSRLFYFFGSPEKVVTKIVKNKKIDAVFVNHDYTPYSVSRDKKIERVCKQHDVAFHTYEDVLLNGPEIVLSSGKKPYQKYTPYFTRARRIAIEKPKKNTRKNYCSARTALPGQFKQSLTKFYTKNDDVLVRGGRSQGQKILKKIKAFKGYDKNRNYLSYPFMVSDLQSRTASKSYRTTTLLAAYLKFGCVSIREAYHAIKPLGSKDLVRQLYWRDFYYSITHHFPHVFKGPLKEKYAKVKWVNNAALLKKWKAGKTGFPLVDACMRQLNTTGFMHNRGRLVTSNFLIKILLINWHKGEKYFAQKLTDYDPAVNNGNWQWGASCGADSQPYFRIFNPWMQSKKFDKQCEFIKQWVPELCDVKASDIHAWDRKHKNYPDVDYPAPCVDYVMQRRKALAMFKRVL